MILPAAWCAPRLGDLTELRRGDVDLDVGVVRVKGEPLVGTPTSTAGVRDVWIPPHLLPTLRQYMADHVGEANDALLFPAKDGRNLSSASMYWCSWPARESVGRPDLRFHDLRHTGAVLAASTGATLAELMVPLGHSTPAGCSTPIVPFEDLTQPVTARTTRRARSPCYCADVDRHFRQWVAILDHVGDGLAVVGEHSGVGDALAPVHPAHLVQAVALERVVRVWRASGEVDGGLLLRPGGELTAGAEAAGSARLARDAHAR